MLSSRPLATPEVLGALSADFSGRRRALLPAVAMAALAGSATPRADELAAGGAVLCVPVLAAT